MSKARFGHLVDDPLSRLLSLSDPLYLQMGGIVLASCQVVQWQKLIKTDKDTIKAEQGAQSGFKWEAGCLVFFLKGSGLTKKEMFMMMIMTIML